MGGSPRGRPAGGRRTIAALVVAVLALGLAQGAGAQPKLDDARKREATLERRVARAHAGAAQLASRVRALAAKLHAAGLAADRIQAHLVFAQRALADAQVAYEAARTRLDQRTVQVFETAGLGESITFLLDADSFLDLMDRSYLLGRVQQADAALADRVRQHADFLAGSQARYESRARERVRVLARLQSRRAALLVAFAEQQRRLTQLLGARREAARTVSSLERRAALRSGTLPFERWSELFLARIEAPACRENLVVTMAWQANEFTAARWNPLATTHAMRGSTPFNAVGVQNYTSLGQGLRATQATLTEGADGFGYAQILEDLWGCTDAMTTADAIRASAWCRGCSAGAYVTDLVPVIESYYDRYAALSA